MKPFFFSSVCVSSDASNICHTLANMLSLVCLSLSQSLSFSYIYSLIISLPLHYFSGALALDELQREDCVVGDVGVLIRIKPMGLQYVVLQSCLPLIFCHVMNTS